jgi:hypothetical protein
MHDVSRLGSEFDPLPLALEDRLRQGDDGAEVGFRFAVRRIFRAQATNCGIDRFA